MGVLKIYCLRYWRGDLGFWLSLLGPMWLGYGAWTVSASRFAEGPIWTRLILVLILIPLAMWQCVGVFRATERHVAEVRNPLIYVFGFGSIAVVLIGYAWSLVVFGVGKPRPPDMAPRQKIEHISNAKLIGERFVIDGEITLETYYVLNRLIMAGNHVTQVRISSVGGSVPAGRGLARLILENSMDTVAVDKCFSACTIVFMAGENRHLDDGAALGFHQYGKNHAGQFDYPVFLDPTKEQEKDKVYFKERGVSASFLERIFDAPNDDIWVPTRAELLEAGVLK